MMMLLLSSVSASAISAGGPSDPSLEGTYPIQFTDGGAEAADMSAWTLTGPATPILETSPVNSTVYAGTAVFSGGTGATGEMSEQLAVPTAYISAVDAGTGKVIIDYRYANAAGDDYADVFIECYDFGGTIIGTRTVHDSEVPADADEWHRRAVVFDLPVNTRSIVVGWEMTRAAGSVLNAYLDEISANWVDTTTDPKTGIESLPPSTDNLGTTSSIETFEKTFQEAGDYFVVLLGSTELGPDGLAMPTISTSTPGVTIVKEYGLPVEEGTFDFMRSYHVTIDSPNTNAVFDAVIDSSRYYRWGVVAWRIIDGDMGHVFVFDTVNNTKIENVFTPLEGSALTMTKFSRTSVAEAEGGMGAPAGTYDGEKSNGSRIYYATGFNLSETELTITDVDNSTRQITIGAVIPPVVDGGYPNDLTATYSTTLANPGAETTDMTGWTTDAVVTSVSATSVSGPRTGTHFFIGPNAATAYMEQTVAIPTADLADVDAGIFVATLTWYQGGWVSDNDGLTPSLTFIDKAGTPIGRVSGDFVEVDGEWQIQTLSTPVPAGARGTKVRFDMVRNGGTELNCYIDDISLDVFADNAVVVDNASSFVVYGIPNDAAGAQNVETHVVYGKSNTGTSALYQSTFVILT